MGNDSTPAQPINNATPVAAAPAAPSAPPVAPPDVTAQPPAPDLSNLNQPAPSLQTAAQGSAADAVAKEAAAAQKASDLASTPPPPPMKHARLVAMLQGIGAAMSGAGTAMATGGKEGGAAETAQILGAEQEQRIQEQQATAAQKNAAIQQQLTIGQTNHALASSYINLMSLPDQMTKEHVAVESAEQGLAAGKADLAKTQAEFMSQFGMSTDQFNAMISGAPSSGAAADPKAVQNMTAFAQQKIDAAGKILRPDDPYLMKAQQVLADPKATPQDIFGAVSSVNRQLGLQQQVQEAKTKKESADAGSPVAKLSTPEALAAPGSQAAIQSKIDDPTTDPADLPRLRALLPQAAVAQFNAENIKAREARTQQALSQGDPEAAGKLLADRSLTIEELKSRQVTPQFIVQAVNAAQRIDPTYKVAEASGQARIAAAPANQQFFGNTDSLLVKGGTLDQLEAAGSALGNGKIPAINNLNNLRKAALGQGPQAAYAAAVLGVADDYSKVMTGGQGSDTSRQQAVDIINKNLSPEGRIAAVAQIRKAVTSQRNGRIGLNPYLHDMYPDPSTRQETAGVAGTQPAAAAPTASTPVPASPAGATHTAKGSDGHLHYTNAQGQDLGIVPGK